MIQRGNSFEAEAFVPVWTSQLFVSDWLQRGAAPVALSLERTGSGWSVKVENNLDHKIGPLRVAVEGRIYELGELEANQSKTNTLDRAQGQTVEAFAQGYTSAFRNAVQQRQSNFGNNTDSIPDVGTAAMAASFITTLNQTGNEFEDYGAPALLDLSRPAHTGYGVLLAWDENHSVTEKIDQFKVNRTHRRSLLRIVAPLPQPTT